MHIDTDEIARLADLVKIDLSPAETAALAREMEEVLGYLRLMDEVDTAGVESLGALGKGELREDVPGETLAPEELEMLPAFDPASGYFAAPAIFGGNWQ